MHKVQEGLPWWLSGAESARSVGDVGLILGLGRSPGGGHGSPLQYSCLKNPMNRGAHAVLLALSLAFYLLYKCLLLYIR